MAIVNNISKKYGDKIILQDVSFTIGPKDRIGLVGTNGTGKSTLLKIIAGIEQPDNGSVIVPGKAFKISYLPQQLTDFLDTSLRDFLIPAELQEAEDNMRLLEKKMSKAENTNDKSLLTSYGLAIETFEHLGGYRIINMIDQALRGLDLIANLDDNVSSLSGGQKMKTALARVLLTNSALLLLDEPTNHLDLNALLWLENFMKEFAGAALVVSHDRRFLDRTVTRIIEIDDETHGIFEYEGNFSAYYKEKLASIERQHERYADYNDEVRRLKDSIQKKKTWSQRGQKGTSKTDNEKLNRGASQDRGTTKSAGAGKALAKRLERLERVEKPRQRLPLLAEFSPEERSGNDVLTIVDAYKSWGNKQVLQGVDLQVYYGQRVGLFGLNGSGKTTLIKAILGEVNLDKGKIQIGARVKVGYFSQEQENLDFDKTVMGEFLAEMPMPVGEARNFLSRMLFTGNDVFKVIRSISPGERSRLILAKIIIRKPNFLIMDEPTNHLDLASTAVIEDTIVDFPGTILIVSHDRYLMDKIGITDSYVIKDGRLEKIRGDIESYERSTMTRG